MTTEFDRARRLSSRMRHVTALFATAVLLAAGGLLIVASVDAPTFRNILEDSFAEGHRIALTPASTTVTLVLLAIQLAILMSAFYCLWRMFGAFASDEPLTADAANWMHRAGVAFLATAATSVLMRTAVVSALTFANPPGERALSVSLGSPDLLAFLMAGVLLITGRIIAGAAEIREDHRAIV
ncbi:DUF2975 domain-containing protein [Nitratireductor mangrovi]|uniref:DUF2975 domain-containing protein n=1 Tax=Nitratireductor mangrovi TaxID=2599600 RepID=A0A5B8L1C8_9HYPH|nr:DUF2975 domain-containing protein [Nitratireductor mangrovi]QDZ01716.1 DUF2975 domain-containing protein [Nitratireductor mangrovi]